MINTTKHRPLQPIAIVLAFIAVTIASTTLLAQDKGLEIVGFEAEMVDGAVNFVAKTRSGKPIPAEQIAFKIRDDVIRITYTGVPLDGALGRRVDFNVSQLPRVTKGYALREDDRQSFVRLRFDTTVEQALDGHVIVPVEGGTALLFPFGNLKLAAKFAAENKPAAEPNDKPKNDVRDEILALIDHGDDAAPQAKAPAVPAIALKEPPPAPTPNKAELPPTPEAVKAEYKPILPFNQRIKSTEKAAHESTLQLASEGSGPSLTKVAGSLVVIVFLLLALVFAMRKLQLQKWVNGSSDSGMALDRSSVKVMATYPVSRTHSILFVRILNKVAVVGQSPGALNLLCQLDDTTLDSIREKNTSDALKGPHMRDFVGKLVKGWNTTPEAPEAPAAGHDDGLMTTTTQQALDRSAGSLEDLARSLEANARAGAARRTQEQQHVSTSSAERQRITEEPRVAHNSSLAPQPAPSTKQIYTHPRDGAASSDVAPINFSNHLNRAEGRDQVSLQHSSSTMRRFSSSNLKPLHGNERSSASIIPIQEEPISQDEILEASRAYRERMRSLGRL